MASALLSLQLEDVHLGVRFAIYVVLRNHSAEAITVTNKPRLESEFLDQSGKKLKQTNYPFSGPEKPLQWGVVPQDAYLGLRVDDQGIGIPTRNEGRVLVAIGGKSWAPFPGHYTLIVTCEFTHDVNGPNNQWVGIFDPIAALEIDAIDTTNDGGNSYA